MNYRNSDFIKSYTGRQPSLLSQTELRPSDPEMVRVLVKLFQIVRQHATQDNDNLCKQMMAEAFQYSEEELL
jgi:DNA-binding transcriptional regulator YdaS (Cro superfamily)